MSEAANVSEAANASEAANVSDAAVVERAGQLDLNAGALAPVREEVTLTDLEVRGRIPASLSGRLVRNGPNPLSGRFEGSDMLSWWPESAMLHGIRFAEGRALVYQNRWLRTRQWARRFEPVEEAQYPETNPNVNVIRYAGMDLALAEGGVPVVFDQDLISSRVPQVFADGITAHPKIDPRSGELVWFRSSWAEPALRYGVCDAAGVVLHEQSIPLTGPAMMHDFAITDRFSLLFDLPVAYDLSLLERGVRIPIRWFDERPSRVGVIPRLGGQARWFAINPCFIQHVANAYESAAGTLVLDAVRYSSFLRLNDAADDFLPNPLGELWRFEFDLSTGAVSERRLYDQAMEMPRINESRTGRKHRFVYGVRQPTDQEMRGIVRIDTESGTTSCYLPPDGVQNSEPVFVQDPARAGSEAGGWLLFTAYCPDTDTGEVVIVDAETIAAGPVARIPLPVRIPAGFHGAWLAGPG